MSVLLVDVVYGMLVAIAATLGGWWLRGSTIRREAQRNSNESRRNREVFARLYELSTRVAADVGKHTNRVEEINEELASVKTSESDVVVTAVARLIQTNQQMQKQLADAQERLREQARQMESSAAEARTDALTGLANRRAFDQETSRRHAELQRYGKNVSLLLIDVDHFKRFNDVYGHQAGDRVLIGLAQVFLQEARQSDLVARYGGEEFSFVLPNTTAAEAQRLAERVRLAVETRRFPFDGTDLQVTISLGAAQLGIGEEVPAWIRRADAALYAAKKAGRNRSYWHDGHGPQPVVAHDAALARKHEATDAAEKPAAEPANPAPLPEKSGVSAPPPRRPSAWPEGETRLSKLDPAPPARHSPQAEMDQQGGVCNRTAFCMVLSRRLAEFRRGGEPLSVLLLRVDGAEQLEERYGPEAAELAMRVTTQFLSASFREMDLVGHFQKGTFAALLPGACLENAVGVAERLRQAVARCKFPVGGDRFQFTVSLAGAEAARDDDTERLLERCQAALAEAVRAGGNRTCVHRGQWTEIVDPASPSQPSASARG